MRVLTMKMNDRKIMGEEDRKITGEEVRRRRKRAVGSEQRRRKNLIQPNVVVDNDDI